MPFISINISSPVAAMMRECEEYRLKTRSQLTEEHQLALSKAEIERSKAKSEKQKFLFEAANQEEVFTRNENIANAALKAIAPNSNPRPIRLAKNCGGQTWEIFCQSGALVNAIDHGNADVVTFLLNHDVDYKLNKEYAQALSLKFNHLLTPQKQRIYDLFFNRILRDLPSASSNDQLSWFLDALRIQPELLNARIPKLGDLTPAMQLAKDNHLKELMIIELNDKGLFDPILYEQQDDLGKTIFDYAFFCGHKELSLWLVGWYDLVTTPTSRPLTKGKIYIERTIDGSLKYQVITEANEVISDIITKEQLPLLIAPSKDVSLDRITTLILPEILKITSQRGHTSNNKSGLVLNPIEVACIKGDLPALKILLAAANDAISPAIRSNTPLLWATMHGHADLVAELIASNKVDVTVNNNIAVITAVRYGYLDIVKQLVAAGADLTAQDDLALKFARELCNEQLTKINTQPTEARVKKQEMFDFICRARLHTEIFAKLKTEQALKVQYLWKSCQISRTESLQRKQLIQSANISGVRASSNQELNKLLTNVAYGRQEVAELILRKNRYLALMVGDVIDPAGRQFKQITAFQYAIWALDWHMWQMLQKFLPEEETKKQLAELDNGAWIINHGTKVTWQKLIDALQTFSTNYIHWSQGECQSHWCSQVGSAQLLLPAHVIQEYSRLDRAFAPCPTFNESNLPRTNIELWKIDPGGRVLGSNFAWARADGAVYPSGYGQPGLDTINRDRDALIALHNTRITQREQLFVSVTHLNINRPMAGVK